MATIDGSSGNDSITPAGNSTGGALPDTGADSIRGLDGDDTLDGGGGDDTLAGGPGGDSLAGGDGAADWLSHAGSGAGVSIDLLLGTAAGGDAAGDTFAAIEAIEGSGANDQLVGDAGRNTLAGGGGADSLTGGNDADSLAGGDGDDTIFDAFGANTMDGGDGADLLLGGAADESLVGGTGDDTLNDINGRNTLDGGEGNDSILGGDAPDTILGGDGADRVTAFAGDDTVDGGTGDDTIEGGAGADTLQGGGDAADMLSYAGSARAVTVDLAAGTASGGDAAGDVFAGFSGLQGGDENDRLAGDGGANALRGEGGADTIDGRDGADSIAGGAAADSLLGGAGNDTIDGGAGADEIAGGDDADSLAGGSGADSIDAGSGSDRVTWRTGDGNDTIRLGDGADTLDLQGWNAADTANDAWSVSVAGTTATFTGNASVGHAVLTVLDYDPADSVVCFVEGTMILTPGGEVPVERLRAGDQVVTPHGSAPVAPLAWVGRLQVDLTRQRFGEFAAPVLVKAGALAEGVPFRDLHVSPNHALFMDGRLVPARLLVNGLTIIHQRWRREVTYHHLELERHALLVSDGALTESYLDDGNRHLFEAPGIVPLLPDFAARRAAVLDAPEPCAPLLAEGDPALPAIRARLGVRAGHLQARRRR